jgi:hypothetical protein
MHRPQLISAAPRLRLGFCRLRIVVFALVCLGGSSPAAATGFQVLTVGKIARFENRGDPAHNGGIVVVGRDRALRTVRDPRCPATSAVEIEAYLQSTFRDSVLAHVDLDCAKWSAVGKTFQYADPTGTVQSIRYGRSGMRIAVGGPGFTPIPGPVGFLQAQIQIGDQLLRVRFHNFRQNDAHAVRSRRPSAMAAAGEAGFWEILLADDDSEARQQQVLRTLDTAVHRDPRDGRSQFLLAMLHLYRFGQRITSLDTVTADARTELAASNRAFAAAVPLLWNDARGAGDSRVPGFAAAAEYMQGTIENDAAERAQGLADLGHAVAVNSFFDVFDYIPILQFLLPSDPVFQQAFNSFTTYLTDPATLQCVSTQPEICANAGFAPHNSQGSLTLFGDLYAKGGNLSQAQTWYAIANAFPGTPTWPFRPLIQDRVANAATRVALYADADPSNDPSVIGVGPQACAVCHNR